ncbi:MAG: HAMP domain-containing histidine kinase [Lachnospiraceae bacterium]|nr:HAMP domain-containing histidine kinase [Lachnospiraceae bacterium]
MKKSLGRKICWIGILLIVAFVLLNVILTYFFMAPFSTLFYREQMSDLGDTLEEMNVTEGTLLTDVIDEFDTTSGVKVTIIDGEKNILYTTKAFMKSTSEYWKQSVKLFDGERKKIDSGEKVFLTRNQQKKNNHKTIQLVMIQKIDENRYAVISRSYQSIYNAMYSAMIFDLLVGIFIVLFGWIVVYRLSRHLIVPIRQMTNAAEHISNLEFDIKVNVTSEDEVGQLGHSINKMSEQLEQNMSQLQEDIESRKRLVRNLSHEIKSPVAVIMGYSDRLKTVVSKNPEKALEYCEIISGESVRIDMLVREMLELSKMEQQAEVLNKEVFEVKKLFENIKYRFQEEYMERRISYEDNFDELERVFADYNLLDRAIYNLIRNAVSHSGTPELMISVMGERKGEYYEIRVYNSGSYINENEISTLWEAFSKVDKVRTRGKQGYGVGLAIVREIVEFHDGYYSAQNVRDGVEFTIAIKG